MVEPNPQRGPPQAAMPANAGTTAKTLEGSLRFEQSGPLDSDHVPTRLHLPLDSHSGWSDLR